MSKDMLGSVVRAAIGVPQERLGLLAQIASKFAGDNPKGDVWHAHLGKTVKNGLPDTKPAVPPAKRAVEDPTIIELGEFEVDYDETIAEKLEGIINAKCISWRWSDREWATDEKFPDSRKGKKRYKASAVCFHKDMPQKGENSVEVWCKNNKKILATPNEGIDLARVNPRPKLDNVMPLAMAGQFFVDSGHYCSALYFDRDGDWRSLVDVWLYPDERWRDYRWFLILEELPSAT